MVRKAITALLVLALVLIGLSPIGAPSASAMAIAMDPPQPCCADCDQPALPDDRGCGAMALCAVTSPLTILDSSPVTVFFAVRLVLDLPDQSLAPSLSAAPPFRPPRSSTLA